MRLKSIKLAGFKSFVDPTTVAFPSNLCAVVGPNGCGKSNIIDAVRWVMGESSAKQLRGESMTDVIFNGSGGRKPVGQASIELIFDNTDGTVVGEFAAYTEISVKRKVTRDAQNTYYLNGSKCRRKDITDLFLGTGLGPRSYAIIEQGMISNLIEAKPEELRVTIEEAAGISKYKERRRDTENRINRTMENLERLRDIRDELERQLARLERQSKAAEKYGDYKQQERWFKAQQLVLQIKQLEEKAESNKSKISEYELKVESVVTEQVGRDTAIEKLRTQFTDLSDTFNEVQGRYYAAGTDIARIEQSIQHAQQRSYELKNELSQTQKESQEAQQQLDADQEKVQIWDAESDEIAPLLEDVQVAEQSSTEILLEAEEVMQNWQSEWDSFNQQAAVPQQTAEVQQSRIQHIEQVQVRLLDRIKNLEEEQKQIAPSVDDEAIQQLQEEIAIAEMDLEQKREGLQSNSESITDSRQQSEHMQQLLDEQRSELQQSRGRFASLEALQQAATEENGIEPWLNEQGLADNQRLADGVSAESGWERALETVLGDSLQAICVNGFDNVTARLNSLQQGSVTLLDSSAENQSGDFHKAQRLMDKVSSEIPVNGLLDGIYAAENMEEALSLRSQLSPVESVVTRDGYWLGNNWLRVRNSKDAQFGVLERKQEIENIEGRITELQNSIEDLSAQRQDRQETIKSAEQQRGQLQREIDEINKSISQAQSELSAKRARVEEISNRRERTETDLHDANEQLEIESNSLVEARGTLSEAIELMENNNAERERLMGLRDEHRQKLDQARQTARHDKDKRHELALRYQSLKTQSDSIKESIDRLQAQIRRQNERSELLQSNYDELQEPLLENKEELTILLEKRVDVEAELATARQAMETVEQELRENESQRHQIDERLQITRQQLEQERIEAQTFRVQQENNEKLLQQENYELQQVLSEMDPEITIEATIEELEKISNRISRLGPINLAAVDEYKIESERKTYLDEQNADLEDALETLQEAIRKIDLETRNRFKETFEAVNSGLQDLFPKVFGGGSAYLELTGDDMLDTGIAIMARPPGKRNSTIHLLSGGEKALTAVALVFSIFHLNPAPFCMLDEVDAPLDDANVGRYANLIKEMSKNVQFIYITHNKISMEVAHQLMGITMHEPGVSRLVSVDVNEAAELAAV